MMLGHNWRLTDRPDLGAMNSANLLIRSLDLRDSRALPDLRNGSTILVGSDYSGQHSASKYEAYSFVFADVDCCGPWFKERGDLRAMSLLSKRRFSYKALADRKRSFLLPQFLKAADLIHGLVVVILVDKSIDSLFNEHGRITTSDPEIRSFLGWTPHVIEKLLRICHFLAFFLAGLSREHQDILWITDQDDVVANLDKHEKFVDTFSIIVSHYLNHTLRHIRVATTASDTGKRDVEDFVAIADMAAGAVCEALNAYRRADLLPVPELVLPVPNNINKKAVQLMNWFSDSGNKSLKRLVISFEPKPDSKKLLVRHYDFAGSRRLMY